MYVSHFLVIKGQLTPKFTSLPIHYRLICTCTDFRTEYFAVVCCRGRVRKGAGFVHLWTSRERPVFEPHHGAHRQGTFTVDDTDRSSPACYSPREGEMSTNLRNQSINQRRRGTPDRCLRSAGRPSFWILRQMYPLR